jgi:hypothetical protein
MRRSGDRERVSLAPAKSRKVIWKLIKMLNLAIAQRFARARLHRLPKNSRDSCILKGLGFRPSRNSNKLNAASAAEMVGVAGQLLFSNALGAVLASMIVVQ